MNSGRSPDGSGCQPTASAAGASSQSGIPNADAYEHDVALLARRMVTDEEAVVAQDVARHVSGKVHDLLKMHGLTMPTVGGVVVLGVTVARQILEETVLFARNSMEGVADEEAAVEAATRRLFDDLGPASAIEAAAAGETGTGSTEGESAVGDSRDAQPPSQSPSENNGA